MVFCCLTSTYGGREHSMSFEIAHAQNDTFLTPVLFRDGEDRRTGARVPYEHPVQVGSAYDTPYATVWAENLSAGGIFILTDRPAKIGARFSVKVMLPDGQEVFIPEVEIIYNREPDDEGIGGFGGRFISISDEVAEQIDAAARFGTDVGQPRDQAVSPSMIVDSSTALPLAAGAARPPLDPMPRVSDLALSLPIARFNTGSIIEAPTLASDVPVAPSVVPTSSRDEPFDLHSYAEPTGDFEALPVIGSEPSLDEPEDQKTEDTDVIRQRQPTRRPRPKVTQVISDLGQVRSRVARRARVHPVLWGSLVAGGVLGLLMSAALVRTGGDDPAYASALEPGMRSDTQRVLIDDGIEVVGLEPAPDPVAAAGRVEAVAGLAMAQSPQKAAPLPALKEVPKPRKKARPTPALEAPVIGIGDGAAVLRTYVLESPPRFVIDLVGQEGEVVLPAARGAIREIRVGDHPGYTRIVLDTAEKIIVGKVDKSGSKLTVDLVF